MKGEVKEIIEKSLVSNTKGPLLRIEILKVEPSGMKATKGVRQFIRLKFCFFHQIEKLNFDQEMVGFASVEVA